MLREAGRERLIPVRAVGGMVRAGLVWLGRGGGGRGLTASGEAEDALVGADGDLGVVSGDSGV